VLAGGCPSDRLRSVKAAWRADADRVHIAAPDVEQTFQIAKAATSTALSSSANPSRPGQPVT
jgi:hypothetical protein